MIGLDGGFLSCAFVWREKVGGRVCGFSYDEWSNDLPDGGGWKASNYKVQEKCALLCHQGIVRKWFIFSISSPRMISLLCVSGQSPRWECGRPAESRRGMCALYARSRASYRDNITEVKRSYYHDNCKREHNLIHSLSNNKYSHCLEH